MVGTLKTFLRTVGQALRGSPHLVPDFVAPSVLHLDPSRLKELGIRHLVFDFDNTLAPWASWALSPQVEAQLRRLREAGFTVAVVSNGGGFRFRAMERRWGGRVAFVGGARKPDPARLLSLLTREGWDPASTLVVGDNVMTDVAAGKAAGCLTLLVRPLSWFEAPPTKLWRLLELVHRVRQPEWRRVRRLGDHTPSPPLGVAVAVGVLATVAAAGSSFLRSPTSEVSSFHLGLAQALREGWPLWRSGTPERSLLLMAFLGLVPEALRYHPVVPVVLSALGAAGASLVVASLGLPLVPTLLAVATVGASPASVMASGEISASPLDALFLAAALVGTPSPLGAAVLACCAVLNGLSGVCLALPLLLRTPAGQRKGVGGGLAVGALLAAAGWVVAMDRSPLPGPGWGQEGPSVVTFPCGPSAAPLQARLLSLERSIRSGVVYGPLSTPIPFTVLLLACCLPSLAQRSGPLASYLVARVALSSGLPQVFCREWQPLLVALTVVSILAVVGADRRLCAGVALVLLATALVFLPQVRRHSLQARVAYRSNAELVALAMRARDLPPDAVVATPLPCLFYLHSGRATVPEGAPQSTHRVASRAESCESSLATATLALCPTVAPSGVHREEPLEE